jgi:hypothetical protein
MFEASYIILGVVGERDNRTVPFCALSWCGAPNAQHGLRLSVAKGWKQSAPERSVAYLSDLLEDIEGRLQNDPECLIAAVKDLSVGPIRTVETGTTQMESVQDLVAGYLGEFVSAQSGRKWASAQRVLEPSC